MSFFRKGSSGIITENDLPEAVKTKLGQIPGLTTRLADITKVVKLDNGEIGTAKIQAALNEGGKVNVLVDTIAYIDGTLQIGDNTELNILNGTLRLKAGTRKYMLINKDRVNGNRNIKVSGVWDVDGENNANSGSYQSGYPGFGMLFHKTDGLELRDIFVMNANKYAVLTVDAHNCRFINVGFNTFSDGLHFQPPINNCHIEKVYGTTHDDMIAFTMEDYANYSVNSIGNVENVTIDGVIADDCWNCIGFHGSGSDGLSVFRDISINNIKGSSRQKAVGVATDSGSEFTTPVKTKIYGLKINNVDVKGTPVANIMLDAYEGDAQISNVVISGKGKFIRVNGLGTVGWKSIQVNNVNLKNSADITAATYMVDVTGIVGELMINNIGIDLSNSTYAHIFLNTQQCNIKTLMFNNVKFFSKGQFIRLLSGTDIGKLAVNNADVALCDVLSTSVNIEVFLNNFFFDYSNLAIIVCSGDGVQCTVQGEGKAKFTITGGTNRKFRFNSKTLEWTKSTSDITNAKRADFVLSSTSGNEGLYSWNMTSWQKLV